MNDGETLPVPFDPEVHRPVQVGYEKARRRDLLAKTAGLLAQAVVRSLS